LELLSSRRRTPRAVPPHLERRLASLRHFARVLDGAFRVPGTNRRFGWDPIVGLVPWVGDAVTLLFGLVAFITAVQLRVPRVVQVRIAFTALIDFVLGLLPVAGDLFDFAFRANARSMALLDRHAFDARPPSLGDYLFVAVVLGVMALAVLLPVLVVAWLMRTLDIGWL
jgi:hypothetical protein